MCVVFEVTFLDIILLLFVENVQEDLLDIIGVTLEKFAVGPVGDAL